MGKRKESWRHPEDVVLGHIWITVGGDGAVGKDQTFDLLWDRISQKYNATKPVECTTRTSSSCLSRWKKISASCMKWRQSLKKAEACHRRGENQLDELRNAKEAYYDLEEKTFPYEHCWPILEDTQKFGKMPTMPNMNMGNSSFPTPIDLDGDETPTNEAETTPSPSTRQARPLGQKTQKLAKKKGKQQSSDSLQLQMQKFVEQSEREYQQRQQLFEEAKLIEQRAEDARTMMVDPSTFDTLKKRGYWEMRQQEIIDKEQRTSSISIYPQHPTHPQDPITPHRDNTNFVAYKPLHETTWIE